MEGRKIEFNKGLLLQGIVCYWREITHEKITKRKQNLSADGSKSTYSKVHIYTTFKLVEMSTFRQTVVPQKLLDY